MTSPDGHDYPQILRDVPRVLLTAMGTAVIAIAATHGLYFWWFWHSLGGGISPNQAIWAQFGDYVGGVLNPILTFLTFLAVLVTVALQRKEVAFLREQHCLAQKAADENSITTMLQRFETSFYAGLASMERFLKNANAGLVSLRADIQNRSCAALTASTGILPSEDSQWENGLAGYLLTPDLRSQLHTPAPSALTKRLMLLLRLISRLGRDTDVDPTHYVDTLVACLGSLELEILLLALASGALETDTEVTELIKKRDVFAELPFAQPPYLSTTMGEPYFALLTVAHGQLTTTYTAPCAAV